MVDLGPRLSKMTALLQANDPGRQEEFAIFLLLLDEPPMARNAVLTVPVPMRDASRLGYAMVGNGALPPSHRGRLHQSGLTDGWKIAATDRRFVTAGKA